MIWFVADVLVTSRHHVVQYDNGYPVSLRGENLMKFSTDSCEILTMFFTRIRPDSRDFLAKKECTMHYHMKSVPKSHRVCIVTHLLSYQHGHSKKVR